MPSFAEWLVELGLKPGAIVADGKWHRCSAISKPRKQNAWWKLAVDGRIGWGRDWSTMDTPATWRSDTASAASGVDFDMLRRQERVARAKETREMALATAAAARYWSNCAALRKRHPYLESKELTMEGCGGLRVDGQGWLVVPAYRDGSLVDIQRISPDGEKLWWKGASPKGSSFCIDRRDATLTAVVEGLATGLAVFQALKHSRAVVGWSCGQLAQVGELPQGNRVICADNDHGTEAKLGKNPGIEAGRKAAETLGAGVVWPEGITGTDWQDWRVEKRKAAVAVCKTAGVAYREVDAEMERLIGAAAVWAPGTEVVL